MTDLKITEHCIDRYAQRVLQMGIPTCDAQREYIRQLIKDDVGDVPFSNFSTKISNSVIIIKNRTAITVLPQN